MVSGKATLHKIFNLQNNNKNFADPKRIINVSNHADCFIGKTNNISCNNPVLKLANRTISLTTRGGELTGLQRKIRDSTLVFYPETCLKKEQ